MLDFRAVCPSKTEKRLKNTWKMFEIVLIILDHRTVGRG